MQFHNSGVSCTKKKTKLKEYQDCKIQNLGNTMCQIACATLICTTTEVLSNLSCRKFMTELGKEPHSPDSYFVPF